MKKFSALLICLLMVITCGLAGCATFSIDKVKYYNEVLATVDETKITRFDLLTAYNSYGNSYFVQQQGQTEEQALLSTLDLLIERETLYQYALDNDDIYRPKPYQINEVVQEVFNSVDNQMNSYVKTAKTILNIEDEEKPTEETKEEEKSYKLDDYYYSPRAEVKYEVKTKTVYYDANGNETDDIENAASSKQVEYNDYYIDYITKPEDTSYEKLIDEAYLTDFNSKNIIGEIKAKYFEHFLSELELNEKENASVLYNKARTMFAKDLISYEYYLRDANKKPYDTVTENLFSRYFERTFKNQLQSQYLENIRTHYLENEELSIELLKEEYEYLATLNYNLYENNHSAYKDKMKGISTNGDTVLYHPSTDTQFGYFVHTLLSFDNIKDVLKQLENYQESDAEYESIISTLKIKPRIYDEKTRTYKEDSTAKEKNLAQIIDEYNLIKNGTYSSEEDRLNDFVQFMFTYNSDPGSMSAGMPYVVGTNGYSSMVEEFTNEAILLMTGKNTKGEQVIEVKRGNMSNANIYDIDSLCITEYGIHLIYYIGDVNSFDINYDDSSNVYIETENKTEEDDFNLYTKIINPLTGKKYFDMMFDLVYPASSGEIYSSNNGYTKYEENLTELSKRTHKVVKFQDRIKATKTSL